MCVKALIPPPPPFSLSLGSSLYREKKERMNEVSSQRKMCVMLLYRHLGALLLAAAVVAGKERWLFLIIPLARLGFSRLLLLCRIAACLCNLKRASLITRLSFTSSFEERRAKGKRTLFDTSSKRSTLFFLSPPHHHWALCILYIYARRHANEKRRTSISDVYYRPH